MSVNKSPRFLFAGKSFFLSPTGGGVLLFLASLASLISANSPLAPLYKQIMQGEISIESVGFHETVESLVSIGPMSLFFLLVTVEIKKEFVSGHLSSWRFALLPVISALGGIIIPALLYLAVSYGDAQAIKGWAVPTATDAAFTLPITLALARHVSDGARIWLMALAVFDDIVGIAIIAVCYGGVFNMAALGVALLVTGGMIGLNRACIQSLLPYTGAGCVLWGALFYGGIHPTIAGVITALCLPSYSRVGDVAPLSRMEDRLYPWVTILILPLFGFMSVGIPLVMMDASMVFAPVTLAIFAGLLIGKPLGVFGATWLALKLKIARLPADSSLTMMFGLSILCSIGFTISLFIANLAFHDHHLLFQARFAILCSSLIAAIAGYFWLKITDPYAH